MNVGKKEVALRKRGKRVLFERVNSKHAKKRTGPRSRCLKFNLALAIY